MTINKRKKNSRHRASHTHGWGSMKKHRGAGNRGGSGKSGSGKRADSKKPSVWKERTGKYGFVHHTKKKIRVINVRDIDQRLQNYLKAQIAKEEAGSYSLNLKSLGVEKLLGGGSVRNKLKITVAYASQKAKQAVEKAGGEVKTSASKSEKR